MSGAEKFLKHPCTCYGDAYGMDGHDAGCVHFYNQDKPWFVTNSDPGDEHRCRPNCNCHPCNAEADKNVCTDAVALVEGHRGTDYGHPSVDLGRTAKLWTALMDFEFTACDVAQMMRMVKESRLRNSPRHRDSLVDIAGYARTQEMIWEADSVLDKL